MASPPHFVFPSHAEDGMTDSPHSNTKDRPQIQLHLKAQTQDVRQLGVPDQKYPRMSSNLASSPPDSPTPSRPSTAGIPQQLHGHDMMAITPPATPVHRAHGRNSSTSSDLLNTLCDLRRGNSTSSRISRLSLDGTSRPNNTEAITFPYEDLDFEYRLDDRGRKKPVGSGTFSDVYLATPCLPEVKESSGSDMTPPSTPVHSWASSTRPQDFLPGPKLYAIKIPASRSAKKVLTAEGSVLSYLIRLPGCQDHVVPYYGQDSRSGALVLGAMDTTLEAWTNDNLNSLDEASRAARLGTLFPTLALSLLDSLTWLHSNNCIHADIKPSNILLSLPSLPSDTPHALYADFSSALFSHTDTDPSSTSLGIGTWDYIDPSLLRNSTSSPLPSDATDLWSLAITLLTLVLGASPFAAFAHNRFQLREMVRAGKPLQCLGYGDDAMRNVMRLRTLSEELGFDVSSWFAAVLESKVEDRLSSEEWRERLARGCKL